MSCCAVLLAFNSSILTPAKNINVVRIADCAVFIMKAVGRRQHPLGFQQGARTHPTRLDFFSIDPIDYQDNEGKLAKGDVAPSGNLMFFSVVTFG